MKYTTRHAEGRAKLILLVETVITVKIKQYLSIEGIPSELVIIGSPGKLR